MAKFKKIFQIFPSWDEIETQTETGIKVTVEGENKQRFLHFNEPVKSIELNSLEALKIAFALLGRIGICENCGAPFRQKFSGKGVHKQQRFCSRSCWSEGCKKDEKNFGSKARAQKWAAQALRDPESMKGKPNIILL